jgi:hypothetical protein
MEPPLNKNPTSIQQLITAHTQWAGDIDHLRRLWERLSRTEIVLARAFPRTDNPANYCSSSIPPPTRQPAQLTERQWRFREKMPNRAERSWPADRADGLTGRERCKARDAHCATEVARSFDTDWLGLNRLAGLRGCRARSTDTQNEVTFTCPSHRQLKEVRPDVLDRAIVLQERNRFP